MFASYEGQCYVKLRLKAVEDPEVGEKLAVAFPFEIRVRLAFSLN